MLATGTLRSRHTTPATPHFSARRANSSKLIVEIASNAATMRSVMAIFWRTAARSCQCHVDVGAVQLALRAPASRFATAASLRDERPPQRRLGIRERARQAPAALLQLADTQRTQVGIPYLVLHLYTRLPPHTSACQRPLIATMSAASSARLSMVSRCGAGGAPRSVQLSGNAVVPTTPPAQMYTRPPARRRSMRIGRR